MRVRALLAIVLGVTLGVLAQPPASQPTSPPGAIQLPEGFRHERLQGRDSKVGRIWKEGGIEIRYDIGGLAGNYAGSVKEPEREWAITQVVNGQPVEIVKRKNGRAIVTFKQQGANFYATVANEHDLAALLTIALTFPAAAAAP